MQVEFTAHNIRLDDGTFTRPDAIATMVDHPWCTSARRILESVFPGDKSQLRLTDLGCLEGGYSVEFARMGFQVLGVEVRESNIASCNYVKSRTNLPNLEFVQDNAWNIAKHGVFDVTFCGGLLYHLDRPRQFLETLAAVTKKVLILHTHFSTSVMPPQPDKFQLSPMGEHEGLPGRWYTEFPDEASYANREASKWASWDNRRSFWIQREHLLQTIQDVGFDLVMEQFDGLAPNISESMLGGYYHNFHRGMFIGVKTSIPTAKTDFSWGSRKASAAAA